MKINRGIKFMDIKKRIICFILGSCFIVPFFTLPLNAKDIVLPVVKDFSGVSLMETLKNRKSSRNFSKKSIPDNILSELLWAAGGINRVPAGKRTAPSAFNMQEIEIYVVLKKGLFLYVPVSHSLKQISSKDIRKYAGIQDYVATAPLNLIYVVNLKKMSRIKSDNEKIIIASTDVGFIGQNVYLYCASKGLATVFRASIEKDKLAKIIKLKPHQKILYSQTVGYPENKQ